LRIKTISLVVALIGAVAVWAGGALASGPNTSCPGANFQCELSVAQTKSLQDASNPGQPTVLIGYLVFDASATPKPTLYVEQNKDGILKPIQTPTGTCTAGSSGSPGTLDFTPNGPLLRFVEFNGGSELRFIDTEPNSGLVAETLGSCRKL
jgi:hypothetical protein